jgi:hypothetical protein
VLVYYLVNDPPETILSLLTSFVADTISGLPFLKVDFDLFRINLLLTKTQVV